MYTEKASMDMDISMDIHGKSVDMDGKFHIHGKPDCMPSPSKSSFQRILNE